MVNCNSKLAGILVDTMKSKKTFISTRLVCMLYYKTYATFTYKKEYLVCHLHEEARYESLANVGVVLLWGELCTASGQGESVHNSRELLSDIISTEYYITCWLKKVILTEVSFHFQVKKRLEKLIIQISFRFALLIYPLGILYLWWL